MFRKAISIQKKKKKPLISIPKVNSIIQHIGTYTPTYPRICYHLSYTFFITLILQFYSYKLFDYCLPVFSKSHLFSRMIEVLERFVRLLVAVWYGGYLKCWGLGSVALCHSNWASYHHVLFCPQFLKGTHLYYWSIN